MHCFINRLYKIYHPFPRIRSVVVFGSILSIIGSLLWQQINTSSKPLNSAQRFPVFKIYSSDHIALPLNQTPQIIVKQDTVRAGDSLSKIFKRNGFSAKSLRQIVHAEESNFRISRVKAGQIVEFRSENEKLVEIALIHSPFRQTTAQKINTDQWMIKEIAKEPQIYIEHAVGSIDSSLFSAAKKAGLPDNLVMDLADIFGHVIDFVYEIRKGDSFAVMFEKRYLDGEFIEYGNILAAEFVNNNESFKAVRFTSSKGITGYFDEKGVSLQKAFLRAPLNFRRISSNFSSARKHPVLGLMRAHKGTDYAAKIGTPIYAAGDGKIIHRARKGGYGKTIMMRHGNSIETRYAHLSRYGKYKVGHKVKQGQIIGYLGATGLATGPHLHYEFILDGVHRNPRKILDKLPKAKTLPKAEIVSFRLLAEPLLTSIKAHQNAELAYQNRQN